MAGSSWAYYDVAEETWHIIKINGGYGGATYTLGGSLDGRFLTGGFQRDVESEDQRRFRYEIDGDFFAARIDQLPDGVYTAGHDVSADGYTVAGWTVFEAGTQALVWTAAPCTVGLEGFSPDSVDSRANTIHPDYTLIGGYAGTEAGVRTAALWGPDLSIRRLDDWIAARGVVVPAGWSLRVARDIRQVGDRTFISGTAAQPDGTRSAFLAKVPNVSEGCPMDCGGCIDGSVSIVDLVAMLSQWGQVGTSCDRAGDGVDILDLVRLLANWGPCPVD